MIEIRELVKTFDGFAALDGASLTVPQGAIYGLVGPNGAGKSTLLRHLTGVYRQDSGTVSVDGADVWENVAVKQRIASDRGHLSNDQASDELTALLSNRLEAVAAMHISENNNEYDLALKTFTETLAREGHSARACCGYQGRLTDVG